MSSAFGIAALQTFASDPQSKDPFKAHEAHIKDIAKRYPWVKMIVMPELVIFGSDKKYAQAPNGEMHQRLARLAQKTGLWLIPGTLYEKSANGIENVAPVFSPDGECVAKAKKLFCWQPYEKDVIPGTEFCIFDVPDVGRFGVCICYDMWFPETIRALMWMGAEVILHPSLTPTMDRELECVMARANAVFNQVHFIDVNAARPQGAGKSIVVDHDGRVLHEAGEGRETIPLEVDFAALRRARERGIFTLGQPLKSFRDHRLTFPQYETGARSESLDALGPLKLMK